ncbi:MAG: hypothetical protein ABSB67_12780 [Bryobacteraceae bacterium]
MESFLNRYRNLTVLLVVVAAQLLLLAWQVKTTQDVRLLRVWSVSTVTPVTSALEFIRRNTFGVVGDYFALLGVREENRRLHQELGNLKMQNHFLNASSPPPTACVPWRRFRRSRHRRPSRHGSS